MNHCHWFCLLHTRDHKNSNKVKAFNWESGYEVTRDKLAGICGHRLPIWWIDRDRLPVIATIYRNGEEKPAKRWSFEMGIGGESDKMLLDFIF